MALYSLIKGGGKVGLYSGGVDVDALRVMVAKLLARSSVMAVCLRKDLLGKLYHASTIELEYIHIKRHCM